LKSEQACRALGNEQKPFRGFDTTIFIIDLFDDEGSIKDLEDMLSFFVLCVEKKNGNLCLPTKYNFLAFLESFYTWVFISSCVFLLSILCMLL